MSVNKISESTRKSIENKSAKSLPDSPSMVGYSPDMIRRKMYAFITDTSLSIISEMNRIVDETNLALQLGSIRKFDSIEQANAADLPDGTLVYVRK
jgi:hypothetical protein